MLTKHAKTLESRVQENERHHMKFKTLKPELLPYINFSQSHVQVKLDMFTKKSFENRWKSQAYLKQKFALSRVKELESNEGQLQRLKNHLKNERFNLMLQRKNLTKRLETNLLIRAAMKEVANNQQYQLGKTNNFD